MDDIRIFCKTLPTARAAVFEIENRVRRLHLNLQTAKTRILVEGTDKQISNSLFDDRIPQISAVRDGAKKAKLSLGSARTLLFQIAREPPKNSESQKIVTRSKEAKSALTDRAMRLWMNTSLSIGSQDYINTLMGQLLTNPDPRLMKVLINTARRFPKRNAIQKNLNKFMESDFNIFPHQESQILHASRYFNNIDKRISERCAYNAYTLSKPFQLRIQSFVLLALTIHTIDEMKDAFVKLTLERSVLVMPYYLCVLAQEWGSGRRRLIEFYLEHPNSHVARFGAFVRKLDFDVSGAKRFLRYAFQDPMGVRLSDWMGPVWFCSNSMSEGIRNEVSKLATKRLTTETSTQRKQCLEKILKNAQTPITGHS